MTALDESIKIFEEAKKVATNKNYDYLDPRNVDFDMDYDEFMEKTEALKQNIGEIIEKNYSDVWETPQGIRFLTRFEKVRGIIINKKILIFRLVFALLSNFRILGKRENSSDEAR